MAVKFTLKELADLTDSELIGNSEKEILGVNSLEEASENEASFLANPRYEELMKKSKAGVICISKQVALSKGKNFLVCDDPSRIFQTILELFNRPIELLSGFKGIHPTGVIHETVVLGNNVTIGPHAVIDEGVKIGANSFIGANVYIGSKAEIGKGCILYPSSVVREGCILKNRVILQPGAVIGSCGFGYIANHKGEFTKLAQVGNVILEDDVEIGANSCIDRSRFKETRINAGTKIDNLVQIAHNVVLGKNNAIAALSGIAGSAKTGSNVIMGGQVGVTGHVTISDNVMLATRSGVSKNLGPGKYRGSPAIPLEEYNRFQVLQRQLKSMLDSIKERLEKIESKINSN